LPPGSTASYMVPPMYRTTVSFQPERPSPRRLRLPELGVTPDYRVEVRIDVLSEIDGPMLKTRVARISRVRAPRAKPGGVEAESPVT